MLHNHLPARASSFSLRGRIHVTVLAAWAVLLAASLSARAEVPENYLKRWDDPFVQKRIADGIERNRKSDALLQEV